MRAGGAGSRAGVPGLGGGRPTARDGWNGPSRRDGEASRAHLAAWQDDEDAFFRADRTRERADLLVTATEP